MGLLKKTRKEIRELFSGSIQLDIDDELLNKIIDKYTIKRDGVEMYNGKKIVEEYLTNVKRIKNLDKFADYTDSELCSFIQNRKIIENDPTTIKAAHDKIDTSIELTGLSRSCFCFEAIYRELQKQKVRV